MHTLVYLCKTKFLLQDTWFCTKWCPSWKICDDPLACKERWKSETATNIIVKTHLFVSEQEGIWRPKQVYFHKLSGNFWILSLYLTQGTVRTAIELFIASNYYLYCYYLEACVLYFLSKFTIWTGSQWDILHYMSNLLH